MSSANNVLNTNNQQFTNHDTSIIFLRDNLYSQFVYVNSTYDDVVLDPGTLMGRISSTDYVVPLTSGASNGSQFPVGILAHPVTIEAGELVTLTLAVKGEIRKDKIIFQGSDGFSTTVSSIDLIDRIEQIGLHLVPVTNLTNFDNV